MYIQERPIDIIDVSGEWGSNYLPIKLYQHGNKVLGKFRLKDGVLEGTLEGNIFTGTWMHSEPFLGPYNYGGFIWVFTSPNAFEGTVTYGDNRIPSYVNWRGYRLKRR